MSRNPMPPGRWDEAMASAHYQCQMSQYPKFRTGRPCSGRLVVHHRRIRGMGGSSDPSIHDLANLAVLCDTHHRELHDRPGDAYDSALLIRRGDPLRP
jgi:hypothetical protein